jgi:ribosomal protein L30E
MDLSRHLKTAASTGRLLFGQRQTYLDGLAAKHPEVSIHRAMLVNRDLGVAVGKPFSISTICVVDAGDSDLLGLESNL